MKPVTTLLAAGLILLAAATLPAILASAQQAAVTDDNLEQMIANAKTPADHEAIAGFYDKEAADAEAKAKLHHLVHKNYESFRIKPTDMAHHCDELGKYFERVAKDAKSMAEGHRAMAKKAGAGSGE